jgi:hypothetical protein
MPYSGHFQVIKKKMPSSLLTELDTPDATAVPTYPLRLHITPPRRRISISSFRETLHQKLRKQG